MQSETWCACYNVRYIGSTCPKVPVMIFVPIYDKYMMYFWVLQKP